MKKARNILLLASIIFCAANKSQAQEKDLRPLFEKYNIGIYNQGERGTCSVFALTGLLEFEYAHTLGRTVVPLSVEYLNWASNKIDGETEDGTYFSDALKALKEYGICENALFPYYLQNYTSKVEPSEAAIKDAKKRQGFTAIWIKDWNPNTGMSDIQISQVKTQIMNIHPVSIGFRWPKKEEKYRKMVNSVMIVPPEEGVYDGHSILLVGFKDDKDIPGGGYFIFKNSFGKEYAENGYGKIPYEYLRKYANDGVVIHINQ